MRVAEQIERYAHVLYRLAVDCVIVHCHLLRSLALLLSRDCNRGTMHIAPADHQDLVSLESVVTGKDVGWQVATGHMAKMQWPVSVRPSHAHQDVFHGGANFTLYMSHG